MADDDRRAGDWQKRDLRKNANDLIEEPNQKAWCKQTFWIVFFLIVFWPVGIVLCWRSSWHIVAKVLASVAVAFMAGFGPVQGEGFGVLVQHAGIGAQAQGSADVLHAVLIRHQMDHGMSGGGI